MYYVKNIWKIVDNYLIARWQKRPSTALFWYLPEPSRINSTNDLLSYQKTHLPHFYLIDYRQKLSYELENKDGIIVLPYDKPIGQQVNPEAAFQYALGLHDQYYVTNQSSYLKKFWHYVDYFHSQQNEEGLWGYHFDWFGSKAPWYSALAQGRGASVMLRAWLHSADERYLNAAKKAVMKFSVPISEGGFLHLFSDGNCHYYEEYPQTPTGVINGFMASLISIWELKYWLKETWLDDLWLHGIHSLQKMLPYYSNKWWSLYDLDKNTPIINVNSPRYHLLEMHYLLILSLLSESSLLMQIYQQRHKQYQNSFYHIKATSLKLIRKIIYK